MSTIAILGGGAWGLALAKLLAENGNTVRVWEFNPEFVRLLQTTHSNPLLLKDIILPEQILFSNRLGEVLLPDTEYLVTAIPSQFLRSVVRRAALQIAYLPHLSAIINVAKGVEQSTLKRMSELLCEELPSFPSAQITTLSGPSHAEEVARCIPTVVVIAGEDETMLAQLQKLFSNDYFRAYRSIDQIGVEIGGAVKNIIAIAAGIIDGIGYGDNTKGALLTRGIVEIQRLGVALGARPETFLGLSGMGDLITTATSQHSRNRFVGNEIGKGRLLPEILAGMKAVAEGVATTQSITDLSLKLNIDMPITREIHAVLFANKPPLLAITELMTRSLKPE